MPTIDTNYARSGDCHIAYHVVGDGPLDIVFVHGWASNIEAWWEEPHYRSFLERLGTFARVIAFDKRGTGMSDPVPLDQPPMLEQRIDDVRAVMDAVGSEKAAVLAISEGGAMAYLFAAVHPDRTRALIVWGGTPRIAEAPDWPWGYTRQEGIDALHAIRDGASDRVFSLEFFNPSYGDDPALLSWYARALRQAASPGMLISLMAMNGNTDVRDVLPTIAVPTLVMHRTGDGVMPMEGSRYAADQIPDAMFLEMDGVDHWPWLGDSDEVLGAIEEFLTGVRTVPPPERVLATVLFTDIVDSTKRAEALGDAEWRRVLDGHDVIMERVLDRHRGRLIKSTGDGILATFDGPGRAIRAAQSILKEAHDLDLQLRAGLHTGEIELRGDDVGGVGVHLAARVAARADGDQLLVTRTVRDLVAGSGIEFADQGEYELKGVPGTWDLLEVVSA